MLLNLKGRGWWWLPLLIASSVILLCQVLAGTTGFPLDDAWIHQDFARTLATTGQFAFQPGRSAAGETSPLWVLLLLPPYLVTAGHPPLWLLTVWVDVLGMLTLGALGALGGYAAQQIAAQSGAAARVRTLAALLGSLALVSEWHLIWAAVSGMETLFFALLALLVLFAAARGWRAIWVGALASLAVATRPEGWLLIGVVVGVLAWSAIRQHTFRSWVSAWCLPFILGWLPIGLAYVAFNLWAGGQLLPTTFTAKSAEFSSFQGILPTLLGWFPQLLLVFFLSSPVLMGLGTLALFAGKAADPKPAPVILLRRLLWCWSFVVLLAYAGRIGPGYHHSRYLLPILPSLLILAAPRAAQVLVSPRRRMLAQLGSLILLVAALFSAGHAPTIVKSDMQAMNCAEVDMGLWLRDHTPPGAVIAAHDVGALGYFSDRHIIDITGLVDPELIPVLHQPAALVNALKARHVAYVAIYEDWWPPAVMQTLGNAVVYSACGTNYYRVYQTNW